MMAQPKIVTVNVDGPRCSGVTRIATLIAKTLEGAALEISGEKIKYVVNDIPAGTQLND